MSCSACAARIEKGVGAMPGVAAANVNFALGRLTVEYDPAAVAAADIIAKIRDLGYDVVLERLEFAVGGMSCAACAARVEKAVRKLPGVAAANVNFALGRLTVEAGAGVTAAAVAAACAAAVSGDFVVLSPACAAFDQFKNFMERGKVFKELVNAL